MSIGELTVELDVGVSEVYNISVILSVHGSIKE